MLKRASLFLAAIAVAWVLPVDDAIEIDRPSLPADGNAIARVSAHRINLFGARALGAAPAIAIAPPLETMRAHDGSMIVRAGHRAGIFAVTAGDARAELRLEPSAADSDEDG